MYFISNLVEVRICLFSITKLYLKIFIGYLSVRVVQNFAQSLIGRGTKYLQSILEKGQHLI